MGNIYRFADYRTASRAPARDSMEYWKAREEAVHLIQAMQRLGDELSDLEDILEKGDRHPSYSTWEGDLESFLHVTEYSRSICRKQIEAVRDRAKDNLFVIEMLQALRPGGKVWSLDGSDGKDRTPPTGQEDRG